MNKINFFSLIAAIVVFFSIHAQGQDAVSDMEIKEYLKANVHKLDYIEGIWSLDELVSDVFYKGELSFSKPHEEVEDNTFAVIKRNNKYLVYGNSTNGFRKLIKKEIEEKSDPGTYYLFVILENVKHRVNIRMNDLYTLRYTISLKNEAIRNSEFFKEASRKMKENNFSNFKCDLHYTYSKLYPKISDYSSPKEVNNYLGTGFAIISSGIVVTNYHVVSGLSQVKIRGVHGDYSKSYDSEIIGIDRNNDLALLKIKSDIPLPPLPYTISNTQADVGSSAWTVGYPLRESMGDEIKLVNGIISAKSGFKGDITSYQATLSIHPGNSGGPLFNQNGEVIGIINSRLSEANNVAYAIKSSYLINLLESLSLKYNRELPKSIMEGKSLSDQVKFVTPFVYMIEK